MELNLDHLQSVAELQQLVQQLEHLTEISLTLNTTLDPDRLLLYIVETAAHVLDCAAVSIMLFEEKSGQLHFTASTGSDQSKLAGIPVPLDKSIAGTIFRENRPMVIHDVAGDERHYSQVGEKVQFQTRSLLGVPMTIREKTTGVLEALNKNSGDFNATDTYLLSIFASQAAVAIQNARMVQALQTAYSEISRVDRVKTNFMALASHELRTPLMVIMGYGSFLQEEAKGELSEHASMVMNSALRMREVLESMTNVNLLRTGALDFTFQPTSIQSVLRSACTEVEPLRRERGQSLAVDLPEKPLILKADPEKLQLAFSNLLNNAVRFTQRGGEIRLHASASVSKVLVEICDNGIGIAPEELERIFEEFYQVENPNVRKVGGLGLGLTVARGVVELHGGKVWAESPGPGQGATFIVELPRQS